MGEVEKSSTNPAETANDESPYSNIDTAAIPPKKKNFVHSQAPPKGRQWKNLKNVITRENYSKLPVSTPTYVGIEAPPSTRPAKRFADISGLQARYTEPRTGLRYTTVEEYKRICMMPHEQAEQYKKLRGHQSIIR